MSLTLHGYWRSSAAYRVRLALGLKGLSYDSVAHDLRRGAQRAEDYRLLQPQGLVPVLETPDGPLIQSPAILEWLEERYPDPPLLPGESVGRAVVRAMAAIVACDIHPINNLRVLTRLREDMGADEAAIRRWIGHWVSEGLAALETLIAQHGDGYAYGDRPTLADCHILPQVYNAQRFAVDLSPYPLLTASAARLHALVPDAAPEAQGDAG
ncbi:maleylacetoacetate isomerase [Sphingomonas sp. S17]|jgi:maleylpyruvate isomerase|uniref:Maleylacetoacetate isomerase n=2 Tax=Sphingomonas paucimobilis TaxID=13689 RepID=A0A411LFD4_SPHPI|nr:MULTISPECIES: maleylacetoacetate isomerase [Sphingomonas]EGI56059.1 maleylacetoacetate isomerase [Sphingomonas sp. S17]MBQ1479871.1 maleylacetoacetate isomerase [Sphingomonas sp.]MCM3679229.1 maleylacetoacetate isomerase [Sphingomonas paucimobilis]MDG5971982.1 maleylacetoacetate isomerase [Sphingomonas paucimobilis]NNG58010.1 maleylacetoacetate isomerase [Sphingomonas paucimobilis]